MRLVPPAELRTLALRAGPTPSLERRIHLRCGKAFRALHFARPAPAR